MGGPDEQLRDRALDALAAAEKQPDAKLPLNARLRADIRRLLRTPLVAEIHGVLLMTPGRLPRAAPASKNIVHDHADRGMDLVKDV